LKPNIVLVTIDCWRGDHIGVSKDARANTPNLDAIAAESHVFSDAYTCGGWTKIAMTALFSSTFASMHGYSRGKLNPERPILAEELANNGYDTAGFSTNLVCGRMTGFDRGFKTFADIRPANDKILNLKRKKLFENLAAHPICGSLLSKLLPSAKPFYPTTDDNELVDIGLDWLAEKSTEPYFLWLHFMDLHWPYRSSQREVNPQEFIQMWQDRQHWHKVRRTQGKYYPGDKIAQRWQQLYAEETETLDKALGRLFTALKKRTDWQNTALCVTSDHGEEFYEHGTWAHSWNQLNHEGIHVPLILKTPGQKKPAEITRPVSQLDIAPTLLNIASVDVPKKMLGTDLLSASKKDPVYCEMFGHAGSYRYRLSIRHDGYYYLYDGDNGICALYSSEDETTRNIYSTECAISRRFDKLRLAHIAKGALDMLKEQVVIGEDEFSYNLDDDPAVIERLRALGYME
jgi:arylsulfatase